jgi:hypothetical protein
MVCHFVNNFHKVMTSLIVVLPLIVVVKIFLQLHQVFSHVLCIFCSPIPMFQSLYSNAIYSKSFIVLLVMHDSLFLFVHLFFSLFHLHYVSVIMSIFF